MFCASSAAEIEFEQYRVSLKAPWQTANQQFKAVGSAAVRVDITTGKPMASMLVTRLGQPIDAEATEMAESANRQPESIKLLEDRKVTLSNGDKARIVSLEIRAGDRLLSINAPMVFHSIYLPLKDGKSVTFKLKCARADLDQLKDEFESMILGPLKASPRASQ